MAHRLTLAAAAVAACGLSATPAFAGSPFYGAPAAPSHRGAARVPTGSEDYRAIAPGGATRPAHPGVAGTASGPSFTADGHLATQADSYAFRHASGIEGAP